LFQSFKSLIFEIFKSIEQFMKMKNVTIIGLGLIGGSLAMALRRSGRYRVTGVGRDMKKLRMALKAGAVDSITLDGCQGVSDADVVVIGTPVDAIAATIKEVAANIKPGAVITDAGSVKGPVIRQVEKLVGPYLRKRKIAFVGGHPMAGTEKAGIGHASSSLFADAVVALTPGKITGPALDEVKALWRSAGARIVLMTAAEHDRTVAVTSHLPHCMAFGLCTAAGKRAEKHEKALQLVAGSFKDATRVADSSPRDWAPICHANRRELQKALAAYIRILERLRNELDNARGMEKFFSAARTVRKRLVKEKGAIRDTHPDR
jgi:prephenate dehydrogenase